MSWRFGLVPARDTPNYNVTFDLFGTCDVHASTRAYMHALYTYVNVQTTGGDNNYGAIVKLGPAAPRPRSLITSIGKSPGAILGQNHRKGQHAGHGGVSAKPIGEGPSSGGVYVSLNNVCCYNELTVNR